MSTPHQLRWGSYTQWQWPVIGGSHRVVFHAEVCVVCGKKCRHLNKCLSCRRWTHSDCTDQGMCAGGCQEQK